MLSLFAPSSPFEPPSLLYLFLLSPPKFLLRALHRIISFFRCSPTFSANVSPIRVVCLSDTHTQTWSDVPDGDLLIHAGDLTNAGTPSEIQAQIDWLNSLPHPHKVAIAGNHDTYLDLRSRSTLDPDEINGAHLDWGNIEYLQHSSVTLTFPLKRNRRLRIYGAPQIPACGGPEHAFQYPRGQDAWHDTIPADTDILVTHTPPKGYMDLYGLGCEFLLRETWRIKPRLHIFGHVHAGRGVDVVHWDKAQRAFEDGCGRKDGLFRSTLNLWLWIDIIKVAWLGVSAVLWNRVWGGEEKASWLVNASVMYINTGRLRNPPQIIDI